MKRIIAISLLFIFISGQLNLTWAKHFCGKIEVNSSVMLGHGHLDCGMGEMAVCEEDTKAADKPVYKIPDCCTNVYYSANFDDFFSNVKTSSDNQVLFATTFIISLFDFSSENDVHESFIASSPPTVQSNRLVLHQTFLL